MSLTFLGRFLLFVMFATLAGLAGWQYGPPLATYLAEARSSTAQDARFATRALVYRLNTERPVSFSYSQPARLTKILVQLSVEPEYRAQEDGFIYGLRVRLFDGAGTEVANDDIFLHADSPDAVFASGERRRFFRDRREMVAAQDEIVIESEQPATRAELTVIAAEPGVAGIDVRVYERRPFLGSQAIAAFRRRSDAEQRSLASANAFPPDMLTAAEMNYITQNQWRPVGPVGIEGRDYLSLVVYEASRRSSREAAR